MTAHWNTVQPTVIHFDGRCYQFPDYIACNWMHAGSAAAAIKYCFCVHPDLAQVGDGHRHYDDFWHEVVEIPTHEQEERRSPLLEDNLYIVTLKPDEFHGLLSEYENHAEWTMKCESDDPEDQKDKALAERVLQRLREADASHVCVDDMQEGESIPLDSLAWSKKYEVLTISRLYLSSLGFSNEGITSLTDEDIQRIADTLHNNYCTDFAGNVRFLVACEIVEKGAGKE